MCSSDTLAKSRYGRKNLLVPKIAHEAQQQEDKIHGRQPVSDNCSRLWWLPLGDAELEEVKSLHILGVTLDCNLKFETHLQEVASKATKSLGSRASSRKVIWLSTCAQELFQCICFVQLEALCHRVSVVGGVSFGFTGWHNSQRRKVVWEKKG